MRNLFKEPEVPGASQLIMLNARKRPASTSTTVAKRTAKSRRINRKTVRRQGLSQKANVDFGLGFPKILKMTHRYFQTVRIVSSTGVPAFQRFRANGMYDPDQTGVGHQPLYYDQISALYNHWKVIGAKISVTFIPTASTTVPQHVGIIADDDTTSSLDINTLNEQTDTHKGAIAFNNNQPCTIEHNFSAKKVYGPSVMGNTRLEGDATADPTELFYFTIYNAPIDGSTSVGVDALVTIDYISVWTEQKDVGGS